MNIETMSPDAILEQWDNQYENNLYTDYLSIIEFMIDSLQNDIIISEKYDIITEDSNGENIFTKIWNKILDTFEIIKKFFKDIIDTINWKITEIKLKAAAKTAEKELELFLKENGEEITKAYNDIVDGLKDFYDANDVNNESYNLLKEDDKTIASIELRKDEDPMLFLNNIVRIPDTFFDFNLNAMKLDKEFLYKAKEQVERRIVNSGENVSDTGSDRNQFYRYREGKFASYIASEKILGIFDGNVKTLKELPSLQYDDEGKITNLNGEYYLNDNDIGSSLSSTSGLHSSYIKSWKGIIDNTIRELKKEANLFLNISKTYTKNIEELEKLKFNIPKEFENNAAAGIKSVLGIAKDMISIMRDDQKLINIMETIYRRNWASLRDSLKTNLKVIMKYKKEKLKSSKYDSKNESVIWSF